MIPEVDVKQVIELDEVPMGTAYCYYYSEELHATLTLKDGKWVRYNPTSATMAKAFADAFRISAEKRKRGDLL